MAERYSEKVDDPLRQTINSEKQKKQLDRYRSEVVEDPERNTGLPGYQQPSGQKDQKHKKRQGHKSSQEPDMLQKDDQFLDDDNNMRKDADVNQ
jgi:hypothetical protein